MPIGVHPTEFELLLDLYFRRGVSDAVDDWAAPHHPVTRNPGGSPGGPAWVDLDNGLTVLDFNSATPDWLESPAADTADLDFTTGDFSMAAWINRDSAINPSIIFCRGLSGTGGWYFAVDIAGSLSLTTLRPGGYQISRCADGGIGLSAWYLAGATRSGATVKIYINGADATYEAASHVDLVTSARNLYIGAYDSGAMWQHDGLMWRPRIWGRCLPADEMRDIFAMERELFGV